MWSLSRMDSNISLRIFWASLSQESICLLPLVHLCPPFTLPSCSARSDPSPCLRPALLSHLPEPLAALSWPLPTSHQLLYAKKHSAYRISARRNVSLKYHYYYYYNTREVYCSDPCFLKEICLNLLHFNIFLQLFCYYFSGSGCAI